MRRSENEKLHRILQEEEEATPERTYECVSHALSTSALDKGVHATSTDGNSAVQDINAIRVFLLIRSMQVHTPKNSTSVHELYNTIVKTVPKAVKQHMANYQNVSAQLRKTAVLCARELKRSLSRTSRTNPSLKSKRINKELGTVRRKNTRVEVAKQRKEEKDEEIKRRKDEEEKEALKQKRKFNYLMSQTEAFTSFFLNKKRCLGETKSEAGEEGDPDMVNKAAREHLAHLKEFEEVKSSRHRSTTNSREVNSKDISNSKDIDTATFNNGDERQVYEYQAVAQPELLKGKLKAHQLKGLNWLVNLYNQGINGILADDMGLGKTIQAIALLAHLSESEGVGGPFLVVTPSSTLHNWASELARFVPAFSVLSYWGNVQERRDLRKGLRKANVVVTSYQVAISDESVMSRLKWQYMILDEAQAIKNINSQRWNTLLGFKARNRLLLTGTPIQNSMQELWSLLHFIMPTLFDSLSEFSEWFSKDVEKRVADTSTSGNRRRPKHSSDRHINGIAENDAQVDDTAGSDIPYATVPSVQEEQINKLHTMLKPFMLRRNKSDIKDEIGSKEIVNVFCTMNSRQRVLYGEIVESKLDYENILMQLKKVCNHPDLFEKLEPTAPFCVTAVGENGYVGFRSFYKLLIGSAAGSSLHDSDSNNIKKNSNSIDSRILYGGCSLIRTSFCHKRQPPSADDLYVLDDLVRRRNAIENSLKRYKFVTEKVMDRHFTSPCTSNRSVSSMPDRTIAQLSHAYTRNRSVHVPIEWAACAITPLSHTHTHSVRNVQTHVDKEAVTCGRADRQVSVPPLNTFISDSGKLVQLDKLLMKLKSEDHRVLIYFQMTRMMDLFEDYLVKKEFSYLRLDGSSKIIHRKELVDAWQNTRDIFIFILSTRAGGVGINLTAADTVIFYDSDWNPTVDQQAMDRAHRLGQKKDVTVYRLITLDSVEERVIEMANRKEEVQKIVIKGNVFEGSYLDH